MIPSPTATADSLRTATEPRRLEILELIWERELSVNDIASRLPVSVAAVSQHLTKLREAGLVAVRPEGQQRFYRATKDEMGPIAIVLESFWQDRLGALSQMAESMERYDHPARASRGSPRTKGS